MNAPISEDAQDEETFFLLFHAILHLAEKALENTPKVGRACESCVMHCFVVHAKSAHCTFNLNFLTEY